MKILIIGSKGMLGHFAFNYFSKFYETIAYNERYTSITRQKFLNFVKSSDADLIINCVGKIKQKETNSENYYWVNSILPFDLISTISHNQILIQPSTDCVFDGLKINGAYTLNDLPNSTTNYGISKIIGEKLLLSRRNSLIIRVSIIGPELSSSNGLLAWFLKHKSGTSLSGYTDHLWNGITTLEWCKQVNSLVRNKEVFDLCGSILQLGTEECSSKYDLLVKMNDVFEKRFTIREVETESPINRCLKSNRELPSIFTQLVELRKVLTQDYQLN